MKAFAQISYKNSNEVLKCITIAKYGYAQLRNECRVRIKTKTVFSGYSVTKKAIDSRQAARLGSLCDCTTCTENPACSLNVLGGLFFGF